MVSAQHPPKPERLWRIWWVAIRPKTLPASLAGVVAGLGIAVAHGAWRPVVALATVLAAVLLQIGVNLANDAQDYQRGADRPEERLGPPRVTALGWLPPQTVLRGAWVAFGLAALFGLYLVAVGGWPILAIGLAAILSAWAYSGGPYPLGYHGWGEVFVFVFFGPVAVAGTYYLQTLTLHPAVWWVGAGVGLLVTAILVVNNYRDLETDRKAGKRTLAVRLGPEGTFWEFVTLLLLPYLLPPLGWLVGHTPLTWLLVGISLPSAGNLLRDFARAQGRALNPLLARTGQLALVYALLSALGFIVQRWIS